MEDTNGEIMMAEQENPGMPEGESGRQMLLRMNTGKHAELAEWGLSFFKAEQKPQLLEIGCGGGANIARLLRRYEGAHIIGIDHALTGVKISRQTNRQAIAAGEAEVLPMDVSQQTFPDNYFDGATAFETIYFWKDVEVCYKEIYRVLKPGAPFLIANDTDGDDPEGYTWTDKYQDLKIYTISEISNSLAIAGFEKIEVHRNRPLVAFVGYKGEK